MDHAGDYFGLPPPPQKIFDHLNGFLIGHYIMKKALSVAVYNHFSDVGIKSKLNKPLNVRTITSEDSIENQNTHEDHSKGEACDLVTSDYKRYDFENHQQNKNKNNNDKGAKEVSRKWSNDSGFDAGETPPRTGAFLSPIVARVIIEASTHKVHLRKSNTLTFDSTGSSKPLDAIATNLADYLHIPYIRCDCRYLVPKRKKIQHELDQKLIGRQHFSAMEANLSSSIPANSNINETTRSAAKPRRCSLQGSLGKLMQGQLGDTLEDFMAKLYKKSGYNSVATERSLIFLDKMEDLGQYYLDEGDDPMEMQREILQEVIEFFDGKEVELKRPQHDIEPVEENEKLFITDRRETIKINTSSMFFICFGVNDNVQTNKKSPSRRSSGIDMKSVHSTSEAINTQTRKNSFDCNHLLDSIDCSDDEDSEYEDDYSFEGLKQNKLVKMLLNNQHSPIPKCQDLWGMKDVELKIAPEAMEIIANQATAQKAGADGVRTILEKLLFTVKFEIPGKNVKAVEITEDFILGKSGPIYHYKNPHFCNAHSLEQRSFDNYEDNLTGMTEFEEHILQEMEL